MLPMTKKALLLPAPEYADDDEGSQESKAYNL
jgi:hypothetical protein